MGYLNLWPIKRSRRLHKRVCTCTPDGKLTFYDNTSSPR